MRSLSQSKGFYYFTAASLSALFGILLILFFVIKRYGSNNAAMGVAAVTYSVGLTSFFRHWFQTFIWKFVVEHYQLVFVYMAVFAFIGVLLVRMKVFSGPQAQPTSLFDTVRWGLKVISFTLIMNSTASVTFSLLSFPVFFVLMKRISAITSRLFDLIGFVRCRWNKLFAPKHVYLSEKEYEANCQKYTIQEIQKLRQKLIENPELIPRLKCPKPILSLFLLTGMDIIDTVGPLRATQ